MSMSFWEFRSETLEVVSQVADAARARTLDPYVALDIIEQMTTEPDLAYEDGERVDDAELVTKLAEHYGESRTPTWEWPRPLPWEAR